MLGVRSIFPTAEDIGAFKEHGYLVIPRLREGESLAQMQNLARQSKERPEAPFELESHVGYPGAPKADQRGGDTVRRLLRAYQRHPLWTGWASDPSVVRYLKALMGAAELYLSQAHHNCLMTKAPEYSSDTGWHQDVRYWSFTRPELISVWTALGTERDENGGLVVIPGSHKMELEEGRFDTKKFLRQDLNINQPLLEQAQSVPLNSGDVLFFHCRLLHRASRNHTSSTKLSLVFTYHDKGNQPVSGTRSAASESIRVD